MPTKQLMDKLASTSSFLNFVEYPPAPNAKTKRWEVRSKIGNLLLGYIRWKASWRKYTYYPNGNTVLDSSCLSDIGWFLDSETRLHRESRKK